MDNTSSEDNAVHKQSVGHFSIKYTCQVLQLKHLTLASSSRKEIPLWHTTTRKASGCPEDKNYNTTFSLLDTL